MPTHLYYTSLCQTWLQEIGVVPYSRAHQPSRFLATASTMFPALSDSRCFPCLPPWTPSCFTTPRTPSPATPTNRKNTRSTKYLTHVCTVGAFDIWCCGGGTPCLRPRGTIITFKECPRSHPRFPSLISTQTNKWVGQAAKKSDNVGISTWTSNLWDTQHNVILR
jgi:hypothetical protein